MTGPMIARLGLFDAGSVAANSWRRAATLPLNPR
jgi:hypothetical protein